jgi:hypothetical protein
MIWGLFVVGCAAVLFGGVFIALKLGGSVRAGTKSNDYSGKLAVAVFFLGWILIVIAVSGIGTYLIP